MSYSFVLNESITEVLLSVAIRCSASPLPVLRNRVTPMSYVIKQ